MSLAVYALCVFSPQSLMSLRDETMIVLVSQTKLPDSSNPLSDIVGAVQPLFLYPLTFNIFFI